MRPTSLVPFALLFSGCTTALTSPPARVDDRLKPRETHIAGDQLGRTISASIDAKGVSSDFFDGIVRLKPASDLQLRQFLADYDGVIISSTEPSAAARAHFSSDWQALAGPPRYRIRVNLARANQDRLAANIKATRISEPLRFSSPRGLSTFALIIDAAARGYAVAADYIDYPQAFPETIYATSESGSSAYDGFAEPRFGAGADPARSNIIAAWQFVAAHGITRRVKVAIVDRGYWLKLDGTPEGTDSDFPLPKPEQWDLVADDDVAAGASSGKCSDVRCDWHGTGSAGVAVGLFNDGHGRTGVGGLVGDPFLIKRDDGHGGREDAIALAFGRRSDVINVSSGSNCDYLCRRFNVGSVIPDHIAAGGKSVVVASAGNDQANVGDPNYYHPCVLAHVICVGALADGTVSRDTTYSNFGDRIDVFAPSNIPVMLRPPPTGPGAPFFYNHGGTSAAAPLVAGVVALMKAINPDLGPDEVAAILRSTAKPGTNGATRVLDALAAVRKAAEGVPVTPDRFGNSMNLGTVTSRTEEDLNITKASPKVLQFNVASASNATIQLSFPKDLGKVAVVQDLADTENCSSTELTGFTDPGAPAVVTVGKPIPDEFKQTRTYSYRMSGGEHRMLLRADELNSYDLSVNIAPASVPSDFLEANETIADARSVGRDPFGTHDTTLDLTIHTTAPGLPKDADNFLIRGTMDNDFSSGGFGFEVASYPGFQIWQNETPLTVSLFERNNDGSVGKAIISGAQIAPCSENPLFRRLALGKLYYVTVTGEPGRYQMSVGSFFSVRRLNYINLEDVLKKPGPIEIGREKILLLPPDPRFGALTIRSPGVELRLIDPASGRILAEGIGTDGGATLNLSSRGDTKPRILSIRRHDEALPVARVSFDWKAVPVRRTSADLTHRQGALLSGGRTPRLPQRIDIPSDWRQAIRLGQVTAILSGRNETISPATGVPLRFLDHRGKQLGTSVLIEHGGSDAQPGVDGITRIEMAVPRNAATIVINRRQVPLSLNHGGGSGNLSLVLTEYGSH